MNRAEISRRVVQVLSDNSPHILTGFSVAGAVGTAYLTAKSTFQAAKELDKLPDQEERTFKSDVMVVWKLYIPPAGALIFTVVAIILVNRIGTRRAAAVAAAYSLTEKAFTEYRDKVKEKIGEAKETKIRDDVAQDRLNKDPVTKREIIFATNGNSLCYDSLTGRYFPGDVEDMRQAQNDLNESILTGGGYVSLSQFYDKIGLPPTALSEEMGWNLDNLVQIDFSAVLADDGRPCISIDYHVLPVRDYHRFRS